MRSLLLTVYTLLSFTMAYTAPTQNGDASNCNAGGGCGEKSVSHKLTTRGGENLVYGFPIPDNFFPNNIGGVDVIHLATETASVATTLTEVKVVTVQSLPTSVSSPGNHGELVNGLLNILLGSPSRFPSGSAGWALPSRGPVVSNALGSDLSDGSVSAKILAGNVQQLGGPLEGGSKDNLDDIILKVSM